MKRVLSIFLMAFAILITGCTLNAAGKSFLYVLRSDEKTKKSEIVILDENLNEKKKVDIKDDFFLQSNPVITEDRESIYIVANVDRASELRKCILVLNKKSGSIKEKMLDSSEEIKSIDVNDKNIYTVSNKDKNIYIKKLAKVNSEDKKTLEIKNAEGDLLKAIDSKIFLFKNNPKNESTITKLNQDSLEKEDEVYLHPEISGKFDLATMDEGKLYFAGENSEKKGIVGLYEKNEGRSLSVKIDNQRPVAFLKDKNRILAICEEKEGNGDSKFGFYKFNEKNNLIKLRDISQKVIDAKKINNNYAILSDDGIYIYDDKFREIEYKKFEESINLGMAVLQEKEIKNKNNF